MGLSSIPCHVKDEEYDFLRYTESCMAGLELLCVLLNVKGHGGVLMLYTSLREHYIALRQILTEFEIKEKASFEAAKKVLERIRFKP